MGFKKALVAYDGSDHAKRALASALEMVEAAFVRDLVVLYVTEAQVDPFIEPATVMTGVPIITMTETERDTLTAEITAQTRGFEEAVELMIVVGTPKDAIVSVAEQRSCDIIVMGSRGLGAIKGILGSVSYAVIRDAEAPVLIVK